MRRRLAPEEVVLWEVVSSTVRPMTGKRAKAQAQADAADAISPPVAVAVRKAPPGPMPKTLAKRAGLVPPAPPAKRPPAPPVMRALHAIEPNRERRLSRGGEALEARIDLHGMDQDQARAALERFLLRAQDEGHRAALVITGKGLGGDGVLRRRLPDWLLAHPLRAIVAGVSEARRRHGGKGAVYVALKRRG
jgi:DNA-nicking Smr family endonuclease